MEKLSNLPTLSERSSQPSASKESNFQTLKIAIVHDLLDRYGGAERVVEALLDAFPQADLFVSRDTGNPQTEGIRKRFQVNRLTSSQVPEKTPASNMQHANLTTCNRKLRSSFMQRLPFFRLLAKIYTPLYPLAFESFNLDTYDVVISSTAHFAKGVLTKPHQLHICYCHTPPRFLYHYPTETTNRELLIFRPFVRVLDHLFRQYDFTIAQRPDIMIANSENTQKRILKFYRRESKIIYPPVDIQKFQVKELASSRVSETETLFNNPKPTTLSERSEQPANQLTSNPYYIFFSRLLPYKKIDTLIEAFNENGKQLVIVGEGSDKSRLEEMANDNITFTGFVSDERLVSLVQGAKAFIFTATDEDFGIVMVESLAAGTPVIAYNGGGAKEIITDGKNGILYNESTKAGINEALQRFEEIGETFDPQKLYESAERFSKERFVGEIYEIVAR